MRCAGIIDGPGSSPRSGDPTLDPTRPTPPPAQPAPPLGLKAQFGATRDAAFGLASAHIDLAKAEASAIGGQVARAAGLVAVALAFVLLIGFLLVVGLTLWTAEWLLGSMGWGILHGVLMFGGIAMACVLVAVGVSGRRIGGAFAVALLIGIAVSLVLAFQLPNRLYVAIGDAAATTIEPGVRPLVVGVVVWAILGLLAAIILAWRGGIRGGGVVGAGIAGLVVGALLGALTAITFTPEVGVALGAAAGWASWIALMAMDVARTGIDTDALKARFYPGQTIDTTKETLEWLKQRMPRANES